MGDPVEGSVEQEHPAVPLLVVAEGCLEGEGCPAGADSEGADSEGAGSEGAGSEGADYDLSALLGAEPGPVTAAAAAAALAAAEDTAVTADGHTAEAVAVDSAQNTAAAVAAAAATAALAAAFAAAHAAGAVDELTAVVAAALAAAHAAAAVDEVTAVVAAALTAALAAAHDAVAAAADPAVEDAAVDSVVQYCSEHQPVVQVETAMTAEAAGSHAAPTVGPVAADCAPGVLVPASWVAVVGTGTGSGREE